MTGFLPSSYFILELFPLICIDHVTTSYLQKHKSTSYIQQRNYIDFFGHIPFINNPDFKSSV